MKPTIEQQQAGCPRRFDLPRGFFALAQEYGRPRPSAEVYSPSGVHLGRIEALTVAVLLGKATERAAWAFSKRIG